MIKKTFSIITLAAITLFSQSTFALFSKASAMDLEGYYITPKVGVSASEKTGVTNFTNNNGNNHLLSDKNLGDSIIIGVSAGKYIKDNIRLELEVLKRDDYKYKVFRLSNPTFKTHADISSTALFINGFYEFEPLSILNKPLVPYLGGGIGGSQNKMGTVYAPGSNQRTSKTIEELAYKLSAGTLFSIKKNLSLDVAYQYVNLGEFQSGVERYRFGARRAGDLQKGYQGGEIESHEIMIGLQYKF